RRSSDLWTRNGGAHSSSSPCWDGTCAQMHGPNCSPSFTANDIEDVREAVLAGRADTVRRILAAHPEMVVNTERLAIQVEGCADQIIFHMPVSATFAARL